MKSFLLNAGALLSWASTAHSLTYTNVSEVPLYGQSPPVFPSRAFQWCSSILPLLYTDVV